jgi:hypothetical protein
VIAVIAVIAALITGGLFGSFFTMTVTWATVSYSQERMQRKVRYWQAEAARAHSALKDARLCPDDYDR